MTKVFEMRNPFRLVGVCQVFFVRSHATDMLKPWQCVTCVTPILDEGEDEGEDEEE